MFLAHAANAVEPALAKIFEARLSNAAAVPERYVAPQGLQNAAGRPSTTDKGKG